MGSLTTEQQNQLTTWLGQERFSTGQSNLELHIHDISPHTGVLPAGIIWPESTEEVEKILTWSYEQDIPVTPWGAGTSTESPGPRRARHRWEIPSLEPMVQITSFSDARSTA